MELLIREYKLHTTFFSHFICFPARGYEIFVFCLFQEMMSKFWFMKQKGKILYQSFQNGHPLQYSLEFDHLVHGHIIRNKCRRKQNTNTQGHTQSKNKHAYRQERLQYTAPLASAQCKKHLERRKHCVLAIVTRSQEFSPTADPLSGGTGRPKFNQLEMVTTFTYRPRKSMHTISSNRGNRLTHKQCPPVANTQDR